MQWAALRQGCPRVAKKSSSRMHGPVFMRAKITINRQDCQALAGLPFCTKELATAVLAYEQTLWVRVFAETAQ